MGSTAQCAYDPPPDATENDDQRGPGNDLTFKASRLNGMEFHSFTCSHTPYFLLLVITCLHGKIADVFHHVFRAVLCFSASGSNPSLFLTSSRYRTLGWRHTSRAAFCGSENYVDADGTTLLPSWSPDRRLSSVDSLVNYKHGRAFPFVITYCEKL